MEKKNGKVSDVSRRDFIKSSAAMSLIATVPGLNKAFAAGSDKIRIGVIGCGARGVNPEGWGAPGSGAAESRAHWGGERWGATGARSVGAAGNPTHEPGLWTGQENAGPDKRMLSVKKQVAAAGR